MLFEELNSLVAVMPHSIKYLTNQGHIIQKVGTPLSLQRWTRTSCKIFLI